MIEVWQARVGGTRRRARRGQISGGASCPIGSPLSFSVKEGEQEAKRIQGDWNHFRGNKA